MVWSGHFTNSCNVQLAEYLDGADGPVQALTPPGGDIDSLIEPVVMLSGERHATEQEDIHPYFWPATGRWQIRGMSVRTKRGPI
jgi:phenol 2-monooxygenase (NADPH)